jgi:hypothetical protein
MLTHGLQDHITERPQQTLHACTCTHAAFALKPAMLRWFACTHNSRISRVPTSRRYSKDVVDMDGPVSLQAAGLAGFSIHM